MPSTKRPARSRMTTIRLKILIGAHLQVVDHDRGLPPTGLGSHALDDAGGYVGDRPGQRPTNHDVDLHLVGAYHHAGDFLGAVVGSGLDEATAAHGVDPFRGEGRHGRGPCSLYGCWQDLPGSSSAICLG